MKLINNYGQTVEQYVAENVQGMAYIMISPSDREHLHRLVTSAIAARYGLLPEYELEDGPLNALLKNDLTGYIAKADHVASAFVRVIVVAHLNFRIDFDKSEIEQPYLDLMNQKHEA